MITEDVQYFSFRPALVIDKGDTEFPSNHPSLTSIHVTCSLMIEHQSITHSPTQEFSNHNTEHHFLDYIADHQNPIIPGDDFNELENVFCMCVADAGKRVRSYYSNVIWSRAGKHVVETAFASGASEPYSHVNIDDKDCLSHVLLLKISSNLTPSQNEIWLPLLQHARFRKNKN